MVYRATAQNQWLIIFRITFIYFANSVAITCERRNPVLLLIRSDSMFYASMLIIESTLCYCQRQMDESPQNLYVQQWLTLVVIGAYQAWYYLLVGWYIISKLFQRKNREYLYDDKIDIRSSRCTLQNLDSDKSLCFPPHSLISEKVPQFQIQRMVTLFSLWDGLVLIKSFMINSERLEIRESKIEREEYFMFSSLVLEVDSRGF